MAAREQLLHVEDQVVSVEGEVEAGGRRGNGEAMRGGLGEEEKGKMGNFRGNSEEMKSREERQETKG